MTEIETLREEKKELIEALRSMMLAGTNEMERLAIQRAKLLLQRLRADE